MLLDETIDGMRAKAPPSHRLVAKTIDFGLAYLLAMIHSPVALILAAVYLLTADAYGLGQSLGKRLLRLRVIHPETGWPCSLRGALLRNGLLVLPFLGLQLGVFMAILSAIGGIFIAAYEISLLFKDPYGVRVGDILATTEVIKLEAPIAPPLEVEPKTRQQPLPA